jgi:hypothetical protein
LKKINPPLPLQGGDLPKRILHNNLYSGYDDFKYNYEHPEWVIKAKGIEQSYPLLGDLAQGEAQVGRGGYFKEKGKRIKDKGEGCFARLPSLESLPRAKRRGLGVVFFKLSM